MTLPAYAMDRQNFPEMYEQWLVGPLFRPWADVVVERSGVAAGQRLLDLACGTGIVGRLALVRVGPNGRVVGIDASQQMLAVARSIAPEIVWREGRAESLPLEPGEAFDVVTCHQGLQFFPDRPAAAREMRRALAPGGRLVVATWRPLEEAPLFLALHGVGARHLGPIHDQRHAYGDPRAIAGLLETAGFREPRVEILKRVIRFPDGGVLVRMNAMALLGMSAAAKSMSEEEKARVLGEIIRESAGVLPPFSHGAGLMFEISATVATAQA